MRFVTCSAKENKVHVGEVERPTRNVQNVVMFPSFHARKKKNIKYNKIFLENGAS